MRVARPERRLVTVLFADVSGFTALCENLDAEEVAETMNRVFVELTEVVLAHGGVIDKYIGDCVMALFGAPRAWGDDAERAARAGLEMLSTLDRLALELEPRLGHRLGMRVGINTGLVVAGLLGGRGFARYTVMGDAVNLASRIESASSPGRVLVSGNTQRFIADKFILEDRGLIQVKGKVDRVQAAFVLREQHAGLESRSHAVEGVTIPFLGRQTELADISRLAQEAIDGSFVRVGVVHGASGIGKSRILEVALRGLAANGAEVVVAHDRSGASQPLAGFIDAIALQFAANDITPQSVLAFMGESESGDTKGHLAAIVCRILRRQNESPLDRRTVIWGLGELLVARAKKVPIVVLVDDAKHGDPAFVELLEAIRGRGVPLVFFFDVETSAEGLAVFQRLTALECTVAYAIEPLSTLCVRSIVTGLFADSIDASPMLVDRCVALSEGFPFFAVEYLRSLFALGVLVINPSDGRWKVIPEKLTADTLPESLQNSLQADLDHMPPAAREYLQFAAIGDGSFHGAAVESALMAEGQSSNGVSRAERELVRKGVIHDVSGGHGEYSFRSGRLHRGAYESQVGRTRRERHRTIGHILAGMPAMTDRPMLIAGHFLSSDEPEHARPHIAAAFRGAIERYDLPGARAASQAVALLRSLNPAALTELELLEFTSYSAQLAAMDGRLDEAAALAAQAERAPVEARTSGDSVSAHRSLRVAFCAASRAMISRGDFASARVWAEKAVAGSRKEGECGGGEAGFLDSVVTLLLALHKEKKYDQAMALLAEGREHSLRLQPWNDATKVVMARFEDTEGLVHLAKKSHAAALKCFEASHELRLGRGNPLLMSVSMSNAAIAQHGLGRTAEAARAFEDVLALRRTLGDPERIALTLLNLSELELILKRTERAREHLCEAASTIDRLDLREYREFHDELQRRLRNGETAS